MVGAEKVQVSEDTVTMPKGMMLDLGAVGKGCTGESAALLQRIYLMAWRWKSFGTEKFCARSTLENKGYNYDGEIDGKMNTIQMKTGEYECCATLARINLRCADNLCDRASKTEPVSDSRNQTRIGKHNYNIFGFPLSFGRGYDDSFGENFSNDGGNHNG